ncbi:MAG: hypothetical protein M1827_006032 [Pycnora praestabilis]|nr:MAG: hypothetical protein M1827_006032 [Pycnora praestabilis]
MSKRDVNWIDGLRGMASFLVVTGHLCTAFLPLIHSPALTERKPPIIFQLPFIRVFFVGGRTSVALFFLITGYVNSLNSIRKSQAGATDAALSDLARSSLTRAGRLILPTAAATFCSWLLCHLGAYSITGWVDSEWIRNGARGPEPSVWAALYSLFKSEVKTWIDGEYNDYDGTQWTLLLFLQGSFIVYTTLLATLYTCPRYRKSIIAGLWAYSWINGQPIKNMNLFSGIFLAALHADLGNKATTVVPRPIPGLMIILGLFLSSYPQDNAEWTSWSNALYYLGSPLIPFEADIRRYYDSLGASLMLYGVFFSPTARRLFSHPIFNFLGRVSFPVYLIHAQLIKTVLVWMIYGASAFGPEKTDEEGHRQLLERGNLPTFFVAIPCFYYLLYYIAHLWSLYIDPLCAKGVNWMTSRAYGEGQQLEKPSLQLPS